MGNMSIEFFIGFKINFSKSPWSIIYILCTMWWRYSSWCKWLCWSWSKNRKVSVEYFLGVTPFRFVCRNLPFQTQFILIMILCILQYSALPSASADDDIEWFDVTNAACTFTYLEYNDCNNQHRGNLTMFVCILQIQNRQKKMMRKPSQ